MYSIYPFLLINKNVFTELQNNLSELRVRHDAVPTSAAPRGGRIDTSHIADTLRERENVIGAVGKSNLFV